MFVYETLSRKGAFRSMAESTLQLQLPVLLPDVEDERDQCVQRLQEQIIGQKGIHQAHIDRDNGTAALCLHFDPNLVSLEKVQRLATRAGARVAQRYHHVLLPIEGMDCSDCALVIEHSVGRMQGVLHCSVNFAAGIMRVEFDGQKIDRRAIAIRVSSLGYAVPAEGLALRYAENRELIISLASGLLLLLGWVGARIFAFPAPLSLGFYLAAYVVGGWEISRHAWHALRARHFDTDLLMMLAALGAALLGDFAEGALLLFLFSLGHALEERALDRARAAVRALADLTPKTALVRRAGAEVEVPVEGLRIEDVAIVRPGARIPVDGLVVAGRSGVDQSPVTGESLPVDKQPGDQAFAGSVNGEGVLEVQVTRLAKDSTLARVMEMVEEAQAQKSPTQQLTERFERRFVPAVLVADVLLIVVPPLFGVPLSVSFLRAMTFLVAASPCALALGTPAAILAGVAQAARNGVLVKGGAHLENLGRLKAIAFDKTGTITYGKPEVTDVVADAGYWSERGPAEFDAPSSLLRLMAAVEGRSGHPLAQAVVRAAQTKGLSLPEVVEVESLTGRGLRANVDGEALLTGSLTLMDQSGVAVAGPLRQQAEILQAEGKTVMLVAIDGRAAGLLALADTIRSDARATMNALQAIGVSKTIMLTGDNGRVAAAIARLAGVSDYQGGLMPEDKLLAVRKLVADYGQVAMVGDGVNDAPALANATVGIAMGGAGTDVALETADVALMADDLSKLPFAVGLGRATRAIVVQNLVIALGVIGALSITSLFGLVGIGVAVVFHEGSTILVVLNALRLLGFRVDPARRPEAPFGAQGRLSQS